MDDKKETIDKLRALEEIILEGDEIQQLLEGRAWGIIKRTFLAQISVYEEDMYSAAKEKGKNIRNFIGRIEALKSMLNIIELSFLDARTRAAQEREQTLKILRELDQIDNEMNTLLTNQPFMPSGLT